MKSTLCATLLIALQAPAMTGAAPAFELGVIRQATPAHPHQYVVPIAVVADGYSTFSATVFPDTDSMRMIRKWELIERDPGVNVVITTRQPIVTPKKITLVAQYQGRKRSGQYWLEPVMSVSGKDRKETGKSLVVALAMEPEGVKPAPVPDSLAQVSRDAKKAETPDPVCPLLALTPGSLMANIERLTAECGYRFGIWHPGDSQDLIDWVVKATRLLENSQGAAGLLDMLKEDYGLLGVMGGKGSDRYIDYYEFTGE